MTLEPGEILLVKVGKHLMSQVGDIHSMIDNIFKREGDRVLVYLEGDVEFTKYQTQI